ncbi:MAG TPA: nucleotidyltransferase domain-containing protein [Acidimicrobiia bacterium]|jgi:hypothetical protein
MGGFEVVDPGYRVLHERACDVLGRDERVVSVTVGGSIAQGTADEWSDLDLTVVTARDRYEDFLADWSSWLAAITPTVFARRPIARFIVNTCTADGLTFDLAVYAGDAPAPPATGGYRVGMLSSQSFATPGEALEYAVAEQLRGLAGPFISLVQRDEHMRHLTGVPHLLGLLTTVFLAESGALPPGKLWNRTFTDEQQGAVAALPPVRATRDDLLAFGLGLGELLVSRARRLYPKYELEWPQEFAAVVASRLDACLGIDARSWLH